jgi:hypothetical protein
MSPKPVWQNDTERDAWMEKHCRVCCQPAEAIKRITGAGPGCPHLVRADAGKLPKAWKKRRNAAMGDTYRCEEFLARPPVTRRPVSHEQSLPLFDIEPAIPALVPVDGWPDWRAQERARKSKDNHA